jgi:dipeptidyl aminopeptidase/acylaminoacyl peptidase
MRKALLIGCAVLVVLVIVAYAGMGYVIYGRLADVEGSCDEHLANRPDRFELHPDWPPFDVSPYFMGEYETVRFPSRQEGLDIAGWWIEADPSAPAVIVVDGLGGCKHSIAVLVPAGMLWRNGFNVLLVDLRDTGDSDVEDGRTSIGNEEYLDVLGAWDWLVEVKGFAPGRIGLFANSMGGATALYAFSEEPRVACIFLQSTFGNLQQVIAAELKRSGYPPFLAPGAIVMGRVVGGENLVAHDPISAIQTAGRRPVYIVHSQTDTRIAIQQSEQLAAAAVEAGIDVTTWFPESSEHVQTPAVYPQEFEERMVGFFREALGE